MQVKWIMTRDVATVLDTASLADAARVMWNRNCGIVPVLDSSTGKIAGLITDRDVCMGALTQGLALHQIPVVRSMVRNVATCQETDDLKVVEDTMRQYKIRRVPVIDADRWVVGIVSLDDIARIALDAGGGAAGAALKRDLARTLGTVATPAGAVAAASEA